ncbi:hypothetical protein GLOIN_2v1787749 [Rhizophagus irregularis DAOM 181602=DAOM 197198]|nr:hypothetical protein GLOIN_2v1787749 [Rhizophagus irregularis DAOM 181602=DAOM 197198]
MDPYFPTRTLCSISSFLRFTPPGGPLTYRQTSRGGYTSGIIPTQSCTANMAPRPGYGIPLDGILPMAAPGSEIEKLPTLFIGGISWKNSQGMEILLNTILSNEPWSFKRRPYFRERAAARERERQREEEERANRRAKAEEERKRSHGRVIREREHDKEEEQRRQAKRKTETEMAFKSRERRWQHHREETMATNREREAERDLDLVEVKKNITKTEFRARELAIDEAYRLREQQEIELEQHRLQTLEKLLWKQD